MISAAAVFSRLDVAMDQALVVQKQQPLCQLAQRAQELRRRDRRPPGQRRNAILGWQGRGVITHLGSVEAASVEQRQSVRRDQGWGVGSQPARRFQIGERSRTAARSARAAVMADEVPALHELHREEPLILLAEELVERDQIAVCVAAQRTKLLLEAVQIIRAGFAQDLERDHGAALAIQRLIDRSEAACPKAALDQKARSAWK